MMRMKRRPIKKPDYQKVSVSAEAEDLAAARYKWLEARYPVEAVQVRRLIRTDGTLVINECTATVSDLDRLGVPKSYEGLSSLNTLTP